MIYTHRLAAIADSDIKSADVLRLWSYSYGGDVRFTLGQLATWVEGQNRPAVQIARPTATGFSVTVSAVDTFLLLDAPATYAAGTLVLPAGVAGAEIAVHSTDEVTALTVTPDGTETVSGAPTTLAAGDYFRIQFAGSGWHRVG